MPSPSRPSLAAASAPLLLAACAAAPLDERGRPQVTLAPMTELTAGAPVFGLTLGQPTPTELRARWQRIGDVPGPCAAFLFSGVYPNDDGPRTLLLGDLQRLIVHAADEGAPVEAIELVVRFPSPVDRNEAERATGLKATHTVGSWQGVFRPVPGEQYGGHAYSTRSWSVVFATDRPGWFLLQEMSSEYGDRSGSLYGVLHAADEAALARGPFTPLVQCQQRVEAALADPELEGLWQSGHHLYNGCWLDELRPLLQRVAAAEQAQKQRREGAFPAALAALRQRWQQRVPGDIDAALGLLQEFHALAGRAGNAQQAEGVGLDERHQLAGDAAKLRDRGLLVTARICELLPSVERGYACDQLLRAALQLDRAGDLIAFGAAEERLAGELRYGPTDAPWQAAADARAQAALQVLFAPLGERRTAKAVRALHEVLAGATTRLTPHARIALRDEAAAFDVTLAKHDDAPALLRALGRLTQQGGDDTRSAWLQRLRGLAADRLAADAARHRDAPAVAATLHLAAYAATHDRWPEPEALVDVLEHGSTADDPNVRAAREAVAPLLAKVLPPFRAGNQDAAQFDRHLATPPVVDWPALWQLGLVAGPAEQLGAAFTAATGEQPPHLRVEWPDQQGTRIVVADAEPMLGNAMFDGVAFAGVFLPPELAEESRKLVAEREQLDAEKTTLDAEVDAYRRRSEAFEQTAARLRAEADAGVMKQSELDAARREETALKAMAEPLLEREAAFNSKIHDYNARLMTHNDARLRHTGEERAHYEQLARAGLLAWAEQQARTLPAHDDAERAALTAWFTAGAAPCGVERLPSRGHGLALLERYEKTLLDAGGAEAIGQRLAACFTLLARCEYDSAAVARRFAPLVTEYAGKLGVDALFDSAAMKLPMELVAPFARALPAQLGEQLRQKADAAVRKAAEQQQRALRR
ncbi:MAG: hypothetical protein H6835_03205 [Planctomycetes bacterium]|nr:hypothetical protein [Planctomycetota bacterium]